MSEPLDVLAVMAHPDDAELLCGGALLKSGRRGERTGVVDLTRGEAGTRGSAEVRAMEAERAADVLGLAVRRNAGLEDAALRNDRPSRVAVAGLLRELRPRVVVTHWVRGRHPDHRIGAQLVYDAAFLAGLTNFDAPGERHRPEKLVYATAFREDVERPSFVVDITGEMDDKIRALECYESQFEGKRKAGEVFPGGDRPLMDQIRVQAARAGSLIRAAYGEPYVASEALAVDTLGSLRVSTF